MLFVCSMPLPSVKVSPLSGEPKDMPESVTLLPAVKKPSLQNAFEVKVQLPLKSSGEIWVTEQITEFGRVIVAERGTPVELADQDNVPPE